MTFIQMPRARVKIFDIPIHLMPNLKASQRDIPNLRSTSTSYRIYESKGPNLLDDEDESDASADDSDPYLIDRSDDETEDDDDP